MHSVSAAETLPRFVPLRAQTFKSRKAAMRATELAAGARLRRVRDCLQLARMPFERHSRSQVLRLPANASASQEIAVAGSRRRTLLKTSERPSEHPPRVHIAPTSRAAALWASTRQPISRRHRLRRRVQHAGPLGVPRRLRRVRCFCCRTLAVLWRCLPGRRERRILSRGLYSGTCLP